MINPSKINKNVNRKINNNVPKYFIVPKNKNKPDLGSKISIPLLVKYLKEKYNIKLYHNQIRIYEDNYYKNVTNIKYLILNEIPEELRLPKDIEACEKLLRMDGSLVLKECDLADSRYLNFTNGVLNAINMVFKSHDEKETKKLVFINQISYNYDPSIKDCEYADNFFNSITNNNEEDINFLYQILGVLITGFRSYKKIFFITGVKDSGKSVFLHIAEKLLTYTDNTYDFSSIGLKTLTDENSKEFTKIIGKRANICGETPTINISNDTLLKQLSGGDNVTAQVKFAEPITFVNKAMLIFTGNKVPGFFVKDTSSISERILIYEFKNAIPEDNQIINLEDKLSMEYIIVKAVEQLNIFIKNNQRFSIPKEIYKNQENILEESDLIYNFYKKCITITNDENNRISSKDLFEAYNTFIVNGKNTLNNSDKFDYSEGDISQYKFTAEIKKHIGPSNYKRNLMYKDHKSDVYVNIKLNPYYNNVISFEKNTNCNNHNNNHPNNKIVNVAF